MAEATFAAFVQAQLDHIRSQADLPYEDAVEDLQRAQSLSNRFLQAERERYQRDMAAWRAEFERGYIRPIQRACIDLLVETEAAKAVRPAIGKLLSRRARRRNRGRVLAAMIALGRQYHQSIQWAWPATGASS